MREPARFVAVRRLDPLGGFSPWQADADAAFECCAPFERETLHGRHETLLAQPQHMLAELRLVENLGYAPARAGFRALGVGESGGPR